jgi:hypothetical protein
MKVYWSPTNKLWYINCPRCKVTHAFGAGHEFDGNMEVPNVVGSLGWTGMNHEGKEVYCHSIIRNGKIVFDVPPEIMELPDF